MGSSTSRLADDLTLDGLPGFEDALEPVGVLLEGLVATTATGLVGQVADSCGPAHEIEWPLLKTCKKGDSMS